ncbi:NitT/TauT family transport system substrate-binding protein [Chelatococcus caeni]|uniref:NitT/TauT family transport system substrate-binding protein n=1 Tax=Chelatococcus caeni TaxID=1348468 RepID=A0A840C1D7_9HYPH|nr:ABC transporter substrate-binding protein [Chelatococcus caeni]MBB4018623.1 NitT/TauT family transport system substrate-binding protein [Chelatococcus caeni]
MIDRRHLMLSGIAALAVRPALAGSQALTLWGPPAAPSVVLAQAAAEGEIRGQSVDFRVWRSPDEMRAGIAGGTMQAVVVPTYVAANFYNRGAGLRLLNVLTEGLLHVVGTPGPEGVAGLAGRRIAVPFANDMPDLVLQRLLAKAGLTPGKDIHLDYVGSPPEAVQLLLAGRVDAALLSEPAASAAILRGGMAGKELVRAVDCRRAWQAATGAASMPQAGLAVTPALADRLGGEGLEALQGALEAALARVKADPAAAGGAAAAALELPAPVVGRAIASSNLVALRASAAREALTGFFAALAEDDPRIIGGRQPDAGFYAL